MGPRAAPALPALLGRLGMESDREHWVAMGEAFKAIGPLAVEALIDVVRSGDVLRLAQAGGALSFIGSDAALSLAEAAERETTDDAKLVLLVVLRELGPMAAPILPALRRFLETTTNEALAQCIVMSLFSLGRASAPAAPEVVRWMLIGDEEMSAWCSRVLWNMGPEAFPAVQDLLPKLAPATRARVLANLERQTPPDAEDFSEFEDIDERLLQLFVVVADCLASGSSSYRKIATTLNASGSTKGLSSENIALQVKRLSTRLKCHLTTHAPRKRSGELTPSGREVHAQIKRYLRVKALRRQSPPAGSG
jgi:hypothetical protein